MKELNYLGKKWAYYSKKDMKEMYPTKKYLVLGEITNKVETMQDMPLSDDKGNMLYVQPLGTYQQPLYRNDGCLWSEEAEGFIVVKKSNLVVMGSACVVLIVLSMGIHYGVNYMMYQKEIDPNAKPYESSIKREAGMDESRILVPGYKDWEMKAGTDEVYVALYNPEENPCNFQFSITLDETKELLFETGLVPPGQAVTRIKLPRKLEEGTYPITVNIQSFSLKDKTQKLNGREINIHMIALRE